MLFIGLSRKGVSASDVVEIHQKIYPFRIIEALFDLIAR